MPRLKRAITTLGVSHTTISESNRLLSPGPLARRSSDPPRLSQTTLCNTCAYGLSLDDCRAGDALRIARHHYGAQGISFPFLGEMLACESSSWRGGAQYEQRDITPPHLPELSDECTFCHTVKSILLDELGKHEWWQTTTTRLSVDVQYEWGVQNDLKDRIRGRLPDFELQTLVVEIKHPKIREYMGYYRISFPVTASLGSCQEWLHIKRRSVDAQSSFSGKNVDLIRSWLMQCDTHLESSCFRSTKREEFLPTRLLDVGTQGSNDPSITLLETRSMAQLEDEGRPLKYICLSYCWGAAQPPLKTTSDTIENYKAGIPMGSMPRVFRDAVLVARTLGIRYLWIDALCIIQGCEEDWHNESAAMADVFSHSWMTIGAAAVSSCHDTLFHRKKDASIDIEFQSSVKPTIKGTISILLLHGSWDWGLDADLECSTWNTRGWVWQEQKLPQRLLIFGEKMLHLRCHQRLLHEFRGDHYETLMPQISPNEPFRWTETIYEYSRRQFTMGRDGLAAISGFVKAAIQEIEDAGKPEKYIAGIWLFGDAKVDLQLCWSLNSPTMSFEQLLRYHKDPQQYIAPSWSWVALNQPLDYSGASFTPIFQLVTHNIIPARTDPTVAISPGSSITLLGKLVKIPGRPSMGTKSLSRRVRTNCASWEATYSGVVKPGPWMKRGQQDMVVRHIDYYLDWNPRAHSTESNEEAHLKLFLLSETSRKSACGLILFPDVVDPRVFLRVGSFEIWGPWESLDWKETKVVIV